MAETTIEWTDVTWNPVRGCARVSPGCEHCYAEVMAARFSDPGYWGHGFAERTPKGGRWTRKVAPVPEKLAEPLHWAKPRKVFVNSTSDLFHEDVPDEFIAAVFGVMAATPQHTYQVLTKRAERMERWFRAQSECLTIGDEAWGALKARGEELGCGSAFDVDTWPLPNVWLGVSVEDQRRADERIPHLLATPAAVRFLSCEPLLEAVDLEEWIERIDHCGSCGAENESQGPDRCPACGAKNCLISTWGEAQAERYRTGERYDVESKAGQRDMDEGPALHWVIVGGESGPGARPFDLAWARSIVAQCKAAGVPVFVKQLGAAASDPENGVAGASLKVHPDAAALVSLRLKSRKGGDPAEWPADLRVRQWPWEVSRG